MVEDDPNIRELLSASLRFAGFAVDASAIERANQFLVKYLEKPVDVTLGYAYNERAFVLYALTETS